MAQAGYVTTAIRSLDTGASPTPFSCPVLNAHAELLVALAAHPPQPIPAGVRAIDIEDRADHLDKVFKALIAYLAAILDDTAQNVRGRLDLPDALPILGDLASDVTGAVQHAADAMTGRLA